MASVRFTDVQPHPTKFLDFTSLTLERPTKQPYGEELPRERQRANQALTYRRLRIEHVNRSVKRCRIVKDRICL
jgi:hypothetical protein